MFFFKGKMFATIPDELNENESCQSVYLSL